MQTDLTTPDTPAGVLEAFQPEISPSALSFEQD